MRPDRLYKRGDQAYFRVNRAFNVRSTTEFINDDYEIIFSGETEISRTGLLAIFSLIPKKNRSPRFIGRWDQTQEVIDVDIENIDEKSMRAFKATKNGFVGHRSTRISQDPRTFLVDISLPSGPIFRGTFTLNIGWGLEMSETLEVIDFVETVPGRNGLLARVRDLFKKMR